MRKDVIVAATFMLLLAQSWAQSDCSPQYDGNGDGAVNTVDMLGLLSEFGIVCADTTTSDTTSIQACGEPVNYQGYDYATVLIGEQCWFAENLRSENYENGDAITAGLSDSEWTATLEGAQSIYENDDVYLVDFGRLYNWHAVNDPRGLCPSGWHVPSDDEYTGLTDFLGGASIAGIQMKASIVDEPGWNGTNTSGFTALPSGLRGYDDGAFGGIGQTIYFWSSAPSMTNVWSRGLYSGSDGVWRYDDSDRPNYGFSVRCIQD